MAITKQQVFIGDFAEKAKLLKKSWGRTDLHSTGQITLDNYLSGGYGRKNGYEIALLYGSTGIGKSTVALNFLADPIKKGVRVGLLVLEDDMADVSNRFLSILGQNDYDRMNKNRNVICLPEDALEKSWNLPDLLKYINDWLTDEKVDLILLDHLQFAFENAELGKSETEWNIQRIFMRELNQIMKRTGKTIILISHVNKSASRGMDKVQGSGAIVQAATKVIEITEDSNLDSTINFYLRKSRFTPRSGHHYSMRLMNGKIVPC